MTEEEAEAYRRDLQETLDRLRKQEDDLKACIRHLRRQSGEEDSSGDENEIRIRGLEFDIGVTRELIGKYEQDIMDLEDARIT
ncbi:MAG: hypothetical protein LUD72_07535 [Bacteroidales bacterium]|nr:hypothetical protein [Bacteroidales bacterium]